MHAGCQTRNIVESSGAPALREECEEICTKRDLLLHDRTAPERQKGSPDQMRSPIVHNPATSKG
jgi:hypothetical protein